MLYKSVNHGYKTTGAVAFLGTNLGALERVHKGNVKKKKKANKFYVIKKRANKLYKGRQKS